jgi:transcriptional regulator with XRE-family HTH domain
MIESGDGLALEQLGGRLRAERERCGLSLRALAARLDISASALSQIETGRSHPSVASLYAIASELGVPLDSLFGQPAVAPAPDDLPPLVEAAGATAPHERVQRASARRALELESGVVWERLTAGADERVDFLHVTYEPGGASSDGLVSHGGREYGLVLDGELTVTVRETRHVLRAGDAICLDSHAPHRLANRGAAPVHGIWAVLHRGA